LTLGLRSAGDGVHGHRLRGLIVALRRAGLRICEALALAEADLDARRGSLLVRRGKGGRRREVGIVLAQVAPYAVLEGSRRVSAEHVVEPVEQATRARPASVEEALERGDQDRASLGVAH
jgi:integrase